MVKSLVYFWSYVVWASVTKKDACQHKSAQPIGAHFSRPVSSRHKQAKSARFKYGEVQLGNDGSRGGNHPVAHRVIIIKKLGWVRHETDSLTLYTNRLSDRPMSLLPQKLVAQLRSGLFTFCTTTALNVLWVSSTTNFRPGPFSIAQFLLHPTTPRDRLGYILLVTSDFRAGNKIMPFMCVSIWHQSRRWLFKVLACACSSAQSLFVVPRCNR